jgi:hypothetical protein
MAFIFGARLCNTVGQTSQNVELFDDLRRVFDVPAGRTKLGINQPGTSLSLCYGHALIFPFPCTAYAAIRGEY